MKLNNTSIDINTLIELEPLIKEQLMFPELWKSLNINYYPPWVERIWMEYNGYRIHCHKIHHTTETCLYHKHRWPGVFKQLEGSYEMGITYSESEIDSEDAHKLPTIAKFHIVPGSYYEMTQTDCLHYVKPITEISYSIMVTKELYPEASFRKEASFDELHPLPEQVKLDLVKKFYELI